MNVTQDDMQPSKSYSELDVSDVRDPGRLELVRSHPLSDLLRSNATMGINLLLLAVPSMELVEPDKSDTI